MFGRQMMPSERWLNVQVSNDTDVAYDVTLSIVGLQLRKTVELYK